MPPAGRDRPFTAFLVVGEASGDELGAGLMRGLKEVLGGNVRFIGAGGIQMEREGLKSAFPFGDMAIMGFFNVALRLRRILRRIQEAADVAIREKPDVVILVDSPEFTQRVGIAVRKKDPTIPIIRYVSPTVWAWRVGRAKAMVGEVDYVLGLLPFEPELYVKLGGPPCYYVGHPQLERVPHVRPRPGDRPPVEAVERPVLLVLPGSRLNEVKKLMKPFGEALKLIVDRHGPVEAILPAVPHLADEIRKRVSDWPVQPTIVVGGEGKDLAFRRAHAALACSGTVSLELALGGIPTVIAYRLEFILRPFKRMLKIPTIVLANVVLGEQVVPEFLDGKSSPERLAEAVLPLLRDTPERRRQVEAFARLDDLMAFEEGPPTVRAAEMILQLIWGEPPPVDQKSRSKIPVPKQRPKRLVRPGQRRRSIGK
ncbi:MAG: lipid-A-disaccharide synthase [Bauldia sp.]|nr:lipid-A-disaccharide synthase [Bauldia sp.]